MQVTSHLLIYSGSFPLLLLQVNDEDLASLLSLGYDEKMARRALRWSFSIDLLTIEASTVQSPQPPIFSSEILSKI